MSEIARTDAAVAKSAASVRPVSGRGKTITRYWGEAIVVALALLLWLPRFSGPIDLRWDAGVYYLLGSSLAEGHGYRILSEPGLPEALQYPPLLPGIVAVYQRILGSTDPAVIAPWLRKSYAVLFVAFAIAVFVLAKRFLRGGLAVAAAALCLLHHQTIFLSDLLFAELPFAVLTVCFALVATSASRPYRPRLREVALFALAVAGFLLRTAGLALLIAWASEALVHRRWRLAFIRGALALVPVLAWQGYVSHVRKSDAYARPAYEYQRAPYQYYNVSYAENALLLDPFRPELGRVDASTVTSRLIRNLPTMVEAVGQAATTTRVQWRHLFGQMQRKLLGRSLIPLDAVLVPMICIAAFVFAGILLLVAQKAWLMVLFIVASIALVWTTPWPAQFSRYLAPLIPFLDICFILAWSRLRSTFCVRDSGRIGTFAQVLLGGVMFLAFTMEAYTVARLFRARQLPDAVVLDPGKQGAYRLFAHNATWRAWEKALLWIKSNAPQNAIIATSAPHFCYLLSGYRAVLPPMETAPSHARRLLEGVPVSYVIVDELEFLDISRRYARPAVKNSSEWRLVYSFNGTQTYGRTTGQ